MKTTMTVQTETFFAAPALRGRIAAIRATIADAVAKRKIYRTTLTELENLTPRDLADLGIAPASIQKIAYEAAYGK